MAFRGQEQETGVGSAGNVASGSEARYHECLRNHAAAQGGHAVDGCGEFMPMAPGDGEGRGAHALSCAACGCHRSFHRRDDGQHYQQQHHRFPLLPEPATPRVPQLMPPPPHPYATSYPHAAPPFSYHHHQQQQHYTPSSGGTTTESSSEERGHPTAAQGDGRRKRFRTRFTAEQKEQMLALADRVGWRMQKQDEALVEQYCALAGVRRQVFKVWMHNNRHQQRRQPQSQQQHSQQQQQR